MISKFPKKHHFRKFPPQLSDDELLSMTNEEMKRCGVEKQTQAQFTYEICREILGRYNSCNDVSNNNKEIFKLNSLIPKIKLRGKESWKQSFVLAISYLKQFEMHTTLGTIETEFQNDDIPSNSEFMEDLTATDYIDYLMRINKNKSASFQEEVKEFCEKENIEYTKKKPRYTDSANRLKHVIQMSAKKRKEIGSNKKQSDKYNFQETSSIGNPIFTTPKKSKTLPS